MIIDTLFWASVAESAYAPACKWEPLVRHYFFHLRDGTDEVLDPEGVELRPEALAGVALMQARDCMAADVKAGRLDLRYRIDVHEEDGKLVHSLSFGDAVEVLTPRRPARRGLAGNLDQPQFGQPT